MCHLNNAIFHAGQEEKADRMKPQFAVADVAAGCCPPWRRGLLGLHAASIGRRKLPRHLGFPRNSYSRPTHYGSDWNGPTPASPSIPPTPYGNDWNWLTPASPTIPPTPYGSDWNELTPASPTAPPTLMEVTGMDPLLLRLPSPPLPLTEMTGEGLLRLPLLLLQGPFGSDWHGPTPVSPTSPPIPY